MTIPNVVVFGETGAGKSSLVNLIAGQSVAQVSSSSVGCTFQSTCYTINIGSGMQINLYDTAGLEDGWGGTVSNHDAIVKLYTLLRRLEDGVSLLIFCMRGPRIKESCVKNWRLFREIICQGRVPIVLAVTGLENEANGMDNWWTQNEGHFMKYGISPNGVACIPATMESSGRHTLGEGYPELVRNVRLCNSWRVPAAEWFKEVIEVSYTSGQEIRKSRAVLGSATQEVMIRCQMTAEEANGLGRKLRGI